MSRINVIRWLRKIWITIRAHKMIIDSKVSINIENYLQNQAAHCSLLVTN
jgi:hypothetical protein